MAEFVANFNLNNNNLDASFDLSEGASFDALFEIYAGSVTWGNILGDITNQTDLQNALNSKASNERVDGIVEAFDNDIENINNSITELSGNLDDLENTVTNNYNELSSSIDSNHQAISNINSTIQTYGDIVTYNASDFATSAQGALADTALQPNDNISELTNDVGYITSASLPVVNNNRITIQKNGSPVGDFTLNQSSDETINLIIPTTAADVGALPDTTTINDLTTAAQQEALNSGANSTNIGQISANTQAIQTETNNRTNADNNLQSQIDAITAASDVTDIVGTYAELQAYDTTNLPNNSIIKVLQDESRNDETTYYRWVITGGVGAWVLIGEEGPYYTKSEADGTFVPQTRTVNGKALSSNIILDASDVGALPDSTVIPTVNNATLIIQKNGANVQTFTANASSDVTANITVPTDTSDLTNGAGFITAASLPTVNNGTLTIQTNGTTVGTFTANQAENTTANIVIPDSAAWGNITGTLSNQTDLQSALDNKQDILIAGTDLEINSVLPNGYTQLKSITATGSQYIDTGIWLTDNFKAEIIGRFTSTSGNQCLLGSSITTSNATYKNIVLAKNTTQYFTNSGSPWYQPQQTNSSAVLDTNKHAFVVEITSSNAKISVDSIENTETYESSSIEENLFLFAQNAISMSTGSSAIEYAQFELESIKLYDNETLIFNGVPAKYGNQAGLYDTVTSTFMPSLGTSDFVAGEEISTQDIINFTNESGYIKSASVSTLTDVTLSNPANGQSLVYNSTSQKWENTTIQTSTAWGSITGTLSNQTDLQSALNAKSKVTLKDWTV